MNPHKANAPVWRRASLTEVCARIGRAVIPPLATARMDGSVSDDSLKEPATVMSGATAAITLGDITLRPHQVDAARRIRRAIGVYGGALLADTVGLGKTYTALAVARDYRHVVILAPAALLPMWRAAIASTSTRDVTLHSLHAFSRRDVPIETTESVSTERPLVIVDEAHYLRNRTTARYANVARLCTRQDVLLISATPMHNRLRELRNVLGMFLGERADATDPAVLSQCVIRRSSANVSLSIPGVREHRAAVIPDNPAVLECILTVASPLPARDGGAAGALIRLGLLRAWCSSDAALTDTIRLRQLRGEAMLHSLSQGRYPTERELRSWIVGRDSVQLGFPELLVQSAPTDCAELLKTVTRHLDSLQGLLQLHTRTSHTDPMRAAYLRQLLREPTDALCAREPADGDAMQRAAGAPVIAFSQFASTVRALHRALGDIAGVASLTSAGGRIASGSIPREELIAQFAPRANGRPPPPARERIRLLLTTDLLAEGVNLQDADTIVHLDLPWTDALRAQRVGRLRRMGSEHAVVHVHTIAPPMGTEQSLRIEAALRKKAGLHREWVGSETAIAHEVTGLHASAAEQATVQREVLRAWANFTFTGSRDGDQHDAVFPIAIQDTPDTGFLAAVDMQGQIVLVAMDSNGASSELGAVLSAVLRVDQLQHTDTVTAIGTDQAQVEICLQEIGQWAARQIVHSLAGDSQRQLAPLQQRALHFLSAGLSAIPATARRRLSIELARAEHQVLNARGAGAEAALGKWLEQHAALSLTEWLREVPVFAADAGGPFEKGAPHASQHMTHQWSVLAMVLFRPHNRAGRDAGC